MIYVFETVWVLLSGLFCYKCNLKKSQRDSLFLWMVFFLWFLMMGLRSYKVGVDTPNYKNDYELISNIEWSKFSEFLKDTRTESLWLTLMRLCAVVSHSYYFFQIMYSLIFNILCAKFIVRFSKNVFLCTLVFIDFSVILIAFNVQRQCLAVMLVVNGLWYIKEKKKGIAVLLLAVAAGIHASSIIFLVAYLLYIMKEHRKLLALMPILIVVAVESYQVIIKYAESFFPRYGNFYGNNRELMEVNNVKVIWGIIIIISIIQIYIEKKKRAGGENMVYAVLAMTYIGTVLVGLSFNLFERLGLYFQPFVPIVFEQFGTNIKDKNVKKFYQIGIVACFTVFHLRACFTMRAIEYSFFFS